MLSFDARWRRLWLIREILPHRGGGKVVHMLTLAAVFGLYHTPMAYLDP